MKSIIKIIILILASIIASFLTMFLIFGGIMMLDNVKIKEDKIVNKFNENYQIFQGANEELSNVETSTKISKGINSIRLETFKGIRRKRT